MMKKIVAFICLFLSQISFFSVQGGNTLWKEIEILIDKNEEIQKNDYEDIHRLISQALTESSFYETSMTELVSLFKKLNKIDTKNSVLTGSFIKNVLIWNMIYKFLEGDGNADDYLVILNDLKLNPDRLKLFYGDKDVIIENPNTLEDYYINAVYTNQSKIGDEIDLSKIKNFGIKLTSLSLRPFDLTLNSECNFQYIARVMFVEKMLLVNMNLFIHLVKENELNFDGEFNINDGDFNERMTILVRNNRTIYYDFTFDALNINSATLMECYVLIFGGRVNIMKLKPLIL